MFSCAKCNRILRTSAIHRIIRTERGNFRAAGLCASCANRYDVEQKRQEFWRMSVGITSVALVFAAASYLLLNYL